MEMGGGRAASASTFLRLESLMFSLLLWKKRKNKENLLFFVCSEKVLNFFVVS